MDLSNVDGKLLDRLVAEARGWRLVNYETYEPVVDDEEREDAAYNDGWMWEGRPGDQEAWQWEPHTSIAAAWELVEEPYTDGWVLTVGTLAQVPRGWRVEMVHLHGHDLAQHPTNIEANADTAPTAICRAYLKAK